ncbi:hypothetical protein AQJ30_04110 [Streptomyces longwoodensis]|uniref:Uncharacterized protein n=1 Tax=Streptomyces longwoodensis TaxID=68231 RepID=A0A101R3L4_9ACTN|nr:hypothetical protein AQJ30_04110 [Streptomyces longwoodensis]
MTIFTGDATGTIVAQIERFAPGFRDRILCTAVCSTTEMSCKNANYVGGDIVSGANDPLQLLFRPRVTLHPYATGADGVFICSAATPPESAHMACRDTGQHGLPCARRATLVKNGPCSCRNTAALEYVPGTSYPRITHVQSLERQV